MTLRNKEPQRGLPSFTTSLLDHATPSDFSSDIKRSVERILLGCEGNLMLKGDLGVEGETTKSCERFTCSQVSL